MSSVDKLSDTLVNSMRTLFNILDSDKIGFVKLTELEKYWDESSNRDFIENLRKICPLGEVTFEKLCIGLKMNKIQNRVSSINQQDFYSTKSKNKDPILPILNRTDIPPQKPPRLFQPLTDREPQKTQDQLNRKEILNNLQKWQKSVISSTNQPKPETRDLGDGQTDFSLYAQPQRHQKSKRRDRRHTLQNSIDYNILKSLKQIELEKEILVQGFTQIEKARNWYLKQLSIMDEKLKAVASGNHRYEQWTDTQQERWEIQKIRISDANRSLTTLMENWDRTGFPMHINLEIRNNYAGLKN